MANISELKSVFAKRGFSKNNRFKVDLSALLSLPFSVNADLIRDMEVMVKTIAIPGRQLTSFSHSLFRNTREYPTGYVNDEFSITFQASDFDMKRMFDEWLNYIVDQESYLIKYPNTYRADIHVSQQRDDDLESYIYGATVIGAYPKSVKSIDFDQSSADLTSFSVDFVYDDLVFDK